MFQVAEIHHQIVICFINTCIDLGVRLIDEAHFYGREYQAVQDNCITG